jgi:precorrin-3B synthase
MTAPQVRGWCPGALRPMASGDGLVVRVRAHGGRLTQGQAQTLAGLAARFGRGLVELSSRANVQIRAVAPADHPQVVARLDACGLIDADAATEARRNLLVTPFWQAGDDTAALALALTQGLARARDLALPGKFGFALDSGATPVLGAAAADIRIERAGDGLWLRPDGLWLRPDGGVLGLPVAARDAADAALALARWFLASGGAAQGRMRRHLAAGARLPAGFRPMAPPPAFAPMPGPVAAGLLVAVPFGQLDAALLAALADLAPIRLTPWRMLLLEGVAAAPALPGLITDPDDPLLRVVACPGAPACGQGLAPVRDLARQLAPHVPKGQRLHVSGCAKGCAHPGPADLTLVARGDGFGLARHGTARQAAAAPALPAAVLADPALLMTRT